MGTAGSSGGGGDDDDDDDDDDVSGGNGGGDEALQREVGIANSDSEERPGMRDADVSGFVAVVPICIIII